MTRDDRRVGIEPAPDDEELIDFLNKKYEEAEEELSEYLEEFNDVVQYGRENGEPPEWSYARLLNNLATLGEPRLIRMLSAFIWRSSK